VWTTTLANNFSYIKFCRCEIDSSTLVGHVKQCLHRRSELYSKFVHHKKPKIEKEDPAISNLKPPTPVTAQVVPTSTTVIAQTVNNPRQSDVDHNCVLPVDTHPDGKTKRLQTSTIIKCGQVTTRVCLLEHYKDDDLMNTYVLPHFTPQPPPELNIAEIVGQCGSPHCKSKGANVTLRFSLFSIKFLSKPIWQFCSYDCVIDGMSQCSDSKFSKALKKIS